MFNNIITPKAQDCPAFILQTACDLYIMTNIMFYLGDPKFPVTLYSFLFMLPIFTMPEFTINKYSNLISCKREIRLPKYSFTIPSIS